MLAICSTIVFCCGLGSCGIEIFKNGFPVFGDSRDQVNLVELRIAAFAQVFAVGVGFCEFF